MKHDKLSTTAFFGNSPRLVHSLLNALSIRLALQHLEQDVDIMVQFIVFGAQAFDRAHGVQHGRMVPPAESFPDRRIPPNRPPKRRLTLRSISSRSGGP